MNVMSPTLTQWDTGPYDLGLQKTTLQTVYKKIRKSYDWRHFAEI